MCDAGAAGARCIDAVARWRTIAPQVRVRTRQVEQRSLQSAQADADGDIAMEAPDTSSVPMSQPSALPEHIAKQLQGPVRRAAGAQFVSATVCSPGRRDGCVWLYVCLCLCLCLCLVPVRSPVPVRVAVCGFVTAAQDSSPMVAKVAKKSSRAMAASTFLSRAKSKRAQRGPKPRARYPVYFKFQEGFTNAVRRSVTMSELL